MSKETLNWLNTNVLVGFTDKRGNAWHYRADEQGAEPNHYTGPVPVADVRRRLFFWNAVQRQAAALIPVTPLEFAGPTVVIDGSHYRVVVQPDAYWLRDDTDAKLGLHGPGYSGHQYDETLLKAVGTLISDSDLGIGSAGLLKGGARAWVQVELPDSIDTPVGFSFRPSLLASTSFDSSSASRYRLVAGVVVCDNTLDLAMLEDVPEVKIRHSRYSNLKVMEAREALGIIFKAGDTFAAAVEALADWTVSDAQWQRIVDELVPIPKDGKPAGVTIAERKQAAVRTLYGTDARAATWTGSALGVLQAFNTYDHHMGTVRGVGHRSERNMIDLIGNGRRQHDGQTLAAVAKVTGRKLNDVLAKALVPA